MPSQDRRMVVEIVGDDKTKKGVKSAKKGLKSLEGSLAGVGTAIGGLGLAALVTQQVKVISEFQRLSAALKVVTGSTAAANSAMAELKDFAATTPFQLQEVVDSFIKLKAMGLEPSREALESYGNTAGAMGKTLNQMIEAVADAATGEFERLKEFGIKAKSEGDNVSFTFQGVTTTIGKNAAEIEGYLQSIGQVQFAGGMEAQMETLGGKISNLQDSWDNLIVTFGEAGAGDTFINVVEGMIWSIEKFQAVVQVTPKLFVALFAGIEKGWEHTTYAFDQAGISVQRGFAILVNGLANTFGGFIDTIADGVDMLPFLDTQAGHLRDFADDISNPMEGSLSTLSNRLAGLQEQHSLRIDAINQTAIDSFKELDAASQVVGGFGDTSVAPLVTDQGEDPELVKLREKIQSKLDILLESQLTEREALEVDYEQKQALLDSALGQKLIAEQDYKIASTQINQDLETGITAINEAESQKRIAQSEKEKAARIQTAQNMANSFGMISNIISTRSKEGSRKDFEVQKIANIGQATMNTYTGATKALATGGVWGITQAALIIAYGIAQVNKIQSQSFSGGGGGGGGAGIGLSGSQTPTVPTILDDTVDADNRGQTVIQIDTLIGDEEWVENNLMPTLQNLNTRDVTIEQG